MNRFRDFSPRWLVAAVASYLAFVIVTAPPSLMVRLIYRASQGRAVLSDTTGTFWTGTGIVTVVGPQNRGISLQTHWHIHLMSILAGRMGVELLGNGSGGSISGVVEAGLRSVAFRDFSASIPASWAVLSDLPMLVGDPDGQLRFESKSFRVGRSGASGSALITWQNAATSQTGTLGSYRLSVNGQGPNVGLLLETISDGALAATGHGSWTVKSGETSLDGQLVPRGSGGALEPLLQFVGPDAGGQRPFSLSGRLPLAF